MVNTINNKGYKWSHHGEVYFKGYYTLNGDETYRIYRGEDACKEIEHIGSFDEFVEYLQKMEGSWSVIVEKMNKVWMAVDIARSMPLYYSTDGQYVSDSAESIRQSLNIAKEDVDKDNIVELYANYYLFGDKTVYGQIKQLDLGEVVEISDSVINKKHYFYHLNELEHSDVASLRKKIEHAAYNTFNRLKAVIGNRPVVLSMSGGYDSRFVGCMLKNVGIDDVSCYTYGKTTSYEVIQSKKNATALGYRWNCVEMTDELMHNVLDDCGEAYLNSYNGDDFTAYMQNFVAVRKLHEDGWFKPNSVFLTGLCGDMPTGCYVSSFDEKFQYNTNTAALRLYDLAFMRYSTDRQRLEKWLDWIKQTLLNLPIKINDYESWQRAVDSVYTGMCHSHWYMHMNSVHAFFDYEWMLPYWDKELLMAWYSIPPEIKYKQKMYEDWLMEVICKPYGLSQKKTVYSNSNRPLLRKIQYFGGGVLNYIYLHAGKPFRRKKDISNFAPLCLDLYKHIKTKSCINYRRSGMMQLLCQYLIESRYGTENLKYVCGNTKSRE